MRKTLALLSALTTLAAVTPTACSSDPSPSDAGASPDATTTDAPPAVDVSQPDASQPDVSPTDGPPDTLRLDAPSPDGGARDALRACAFVHLCQRTTFPQSAAGNAPRCVERLVELQLGQKTYATYDANLEAFENRAAIERLLSCGRSSTSCDDFRVCMHHGALRACAGPTDRRCEGAIAIRCRHSSDAYPNVFNCGALGLECVGGACVPPATAPACAGGPPTCQGSVRVSCVGSRELREDCAAAGGVCLENPTGDCYPAGTAKCTTPGASCQGQVLVGCAPTGGDDPVTVRWDCAAAGRTCGAGCVKATDCADPPAAWGGTCAGADAVTACVEGRRVTLGCSEVGATTCVASPGIASCN